VEPRAAEPPADIGHGAGAVQCGQHSNPVDQQKRRRAACDTQAHRQRQPCGSRHALNGIQVPLGGLMWHEDEASIIIAPPDAREGTEEHRFI
jgi:hypothetical protein